MRGIVQYGTRRDLEDFEYSLPIPAKVPTNTTETPHPSRIRVLFREPAFLLHYLHGNPVAWAASPGHGDCNTSPTASEILEYI